MTYIVVYTAAWVLLVLGFALPGWVLTRLVPSLRVGGYLAPLGRICVGLACWIASIFALCALGSWTRLSFAVLVASWSALAVWSQRGPAFATPQPADARATGPDHLLLTAPIAVLLVALFAAALSPEVAWDAAAYHLTLPRLYVEAGGFRSVPLNVYAHWPHDTELLYSAALLVLEHPLAKLVHFGFGLATLWVVALACRSAGCGPRVAALAAAFVLASPVVVFELQVAYVELAQAFFLIAGVLFMARAREAAADAGPALLLSGVCCGVSIGTKITGITGAAAVAALYLPELVAAARRGALARTVGHFALRFGLPAALLGAPWFLKAAWETGNPFYPFWFDAFGGSDWSAVLAQQFSAWQDALGMGRSSLDYAMLPFRVILDAGPTYDRFGDEIGRHWIALLPLALAFGLRVRLVRCCLAVAALYFAAWSASSQQARLLVPIVPLLAVASAVTLGVLAERVLPAARRDLVERGVLIAAAAALSWLHAGALLDGLRYVVAYQTQLEALERSAVHPVYRFIDTELPDDAKLLFLNTNQGFFCEREYLADSFFEASQIAAWLAPAADADEVLQRLRARGVTHVLLHDRDWGIEYPAPLRALVADAGRALPVYRSADGAYRIFALRGAVPDA